MANIDPTNVTATAGVAGSGTAAVSWTAPVSGAPLNYTIRLVNPANGVSSVVATAPGNSLSQNVSGLTPGETVQFIVQTNFGGNSVPSTSLVMPNTGGASIGPVGPSGDTTGAIDTGGFISLINLINAGNRGIVTISPGIYYVKGSQLPAITAPCTIQGSGAGVHRGNFAVTGSPIALANFDQAVTQLINVENTSTLFTIKANAVTVRDMRLTMGSSTAAPNALAFWQLANSSANNSLVSRGICVQAGGINCKFTNVAIDGFSIGVDFWTGTEWVVDGCWIENVAEIGIRVNNFVNSDGGDSVITNSAFLANNVSGDGNAPYCAILWESGAGLSIKGCKVNAGPLTTSQNAFWYGIVGRNQQQNMTFSPDGNIYPLSLDQISICTLIGNSIENCLCHGLFLDGTYGNLGKFSIIGNEWGQGSATNIGHAQIIWGGTGSGYKVGDVIVPSNVGTLVTGTQTQAPQFVVTAVAVGGTINTFPPGGTSSSATGATGIPLQLRPILQGNYTITSSSPPLGSAVTTGGTGTGLTVLVAPSHQIAFAGDSSTNSFGNSVVHGNISGLSLGGVYLNNTISVNVGANNWGDLSASTPVLSPILMAQSVQSCLIDPQNIGRASSSTPAIVYKNYAEQPQNTLTGFANTFNHQYANIIPVTLSGSTASLMTVEVPNYGACRFELEFEGIYNGAGSFFCSMQRAISAENAAAIAAWTIGTDVGEIAGVAATVGGTNIATTFTQAGFVITVTLTLTNNPNKVVIKVGCTGGTSINGVFNLRLRGNVKTVGYGSF